MLRRSWSFAVGVATVVVAAVALVLSAGLVGWHVYEIPSGAMERTLPVRSYVASRPTGTPARGAIVVYRVPASRGRGPSGHLVKRVIAVGGDTIRCCSPSGAVVVNGRALAKPYVFEDDHQSFGPVTVPAHRLFVAGDHRSQSADSRVHLFDRDKGSISEDDVTGEVTGPMSRTAAHVAPLRHVALPVAALGLLVGGLTELVGRRRRRRRRSQPELR